MYTPTIADRVAGSAPLRRRQVLCRVASRALARIEVTGLARIPARGPVVLAVNHRDFLDGPLLFGLIGRPVTFIVKSQAFTRRMAPVLLSAGQLPVARGRIDPVPVRTSLRVLLDGGVVGIFPEGSRGDGMVRTARPGVGWLALHAGALVVPVACHHTELLSARRSLRRPLVRIVFGSPIPVEQHPPGRPLNRRTAAATTEVIRAALSDLVAETSLQPLRSKAPA